MTQTFPHQNPKFAKKRFPTTRLRPYVPEDRLYGFRARKPEDKELCVARGGGYLSDGYQCMYKRRSDSENGEYCGRHDPIKIRAYNDECKIEDAWRTKRSLKIRDAADRNKKLREAGSKFLQECADGGVNDAKGLALMIIEDPESYLA